MLNRISKDLYYIVFILLIPLAIFLTSPTDGQFWWSDAPRHGLNGIFIKELLLSMPIDDPKGFAVKFYGQYPALTILFYPPLFYAISAPFFLIFGESHAVAQAVVALHLVVLGAGMFAFARLWLDRPAALAASVILLGLPEIMLWGRQVMLEIPALSYVVWAAVLTVRHARQGNPASLLLAVIFALAALYTKLSMALLVPALGILLLQARGLQLFRANGTRVAAAMAILGVIPLVALSVGFGQANMQSVVAIADTPASRAALAGWVWYAKQLPAMWALIPLVFALVGFVTMWWRTSQVWRTGERALLTWWFVIGYVALSLIELKEARHGIILLVPITIWATIALDRGVRLLVASALWSKVMIVGTALVLLAMTLAFTPVPRVTGYREAAIEVARLAPPDAIVLFSGKRDGSFVFNMRTATGRKDLYTVRADKLLLSVAVRRELGVVQQDYTEAEIAKLLHELGIAVVVAQRDFWVDLDQMAKLQHVLDGPSFEMVGRIAVSGNVPTEDRELRIYRARGEVKSGRRDLRIDLPIVGRSIEGRIGRE